MAISKEVQTGSWVTFIAIAVVGIIMAVILLTMGGDSPSASDETSGDGSSILRDHEDHAALPEPALLETGPTDIADSVHCADGALSEGLGGDQSSVADLSEVPDATIGDQSNGPQDMGAGTDEEVPAIDQESAEAFDEEEPEDNLVILVGRVLDRYDREPIRGAIIAFVDDSEDAPEPVTTGSNGIFAFEFERRTQVSLDIRAEGYAQGEPKVVNVPPGVRSFERDFTLGVGGGLVGVAINAETEEPLYGVTVDYLGNNVPQFSVPRSALLSTQTDTAGNFSFEGIEVGEAMLRFTPPDNWTVARIERVDVLDSDVTDMGYVRLEPFTGVTARVFDSATGEPIVGQSVELRSDGTHDLRFSDTGLTDQQGEVPFSVPRNGLYGFHLRGKNLVSYVELFRETEKEVLVPVGTATLRGTVTVDGNPVPGRVRFYRDDGVTNVSHYWMTIEDDGVFEVDRLSGGEWFAQVRPQGEGLEQRRFPVTITEGEHHEEEFAYHNLTVEGTVQLADGDGATSARISARGGTDDRHRVTTAGLHGEFKLTGLTEGELTVRASLEGHGSAEEIITVPRSGPLVLTLEEGDGGAVRSIALDYNSGRPVSGAWLDLRSTDGSFSERYTGRDAEGVLTAHGIPEGSYQAEVSFWSYSVSRTTIDVRAGGTVTLEDVLYPAGALRVLAPEGHPHAELELVPDDDDSIEEPRFGAVPEDGGEWVVRGLYPGNYTLHIRAGNDDSRTVPVGIQTGSITSTVLELP